MILAASDIENALNATCYANGFDADTLTVGALADIIAGAEASVRSYLPSGTYQNLFNGTVPGLILTRDATDGQTVFTLPTYAQDADSAYVWVNPTFVWRDRRKADAVECTVADTTITLAEGVDAGDFVVAEIFNDQSNMPALLKKYCIDFAVNECVLRMPHLQVDPQLRAIYSERIQFAREDLKEIRKGNITIPEWDSLELIGENETSGKTGFGMVIPRW